MEQFIPQTPTEKPIPPKLPTRRNILAGLGSLFVVGVAGEALSTSNTHKSETVKVPAVESQSLPPPHEATASLQVEKLPEFEQPFSTDFIEASALAKKMSREEVIFVNKQTGALLKGPVRLYTTDGLTVSEMTWRYKGNAPAGIPPKWSIPEKEQVSAEEDIALDDIEMQHSYLALQREELGAVDSLQMAALFLLQNLVPDDMERRSYDKFIDDTFTPDFGADTEIIQPELRRLLKSLIAKESLYNPGAKSTVGARGELQIKLSTWKKYTGDKADPTNFHDELPVAVRYFEESYKYITKHLHKEFEVIKATFFAGDHMTFVRDFLIPLLITGYNVGDGNARHVVEWFVSNYSSVSDIQKFLTTDTFVGGKDIFYTMTQSARKQNAVPNFHEVGSTYALDIYGWDKAFADFKEEMKNLLTELSGAEKQFDQM